jgi:hypothetical protein
LFFCFVNIFFVTCFFAIMGGFAFVMRLRSST